jgi:hypothetical protein
LNYNLNETTNFAVGYTYSRNYQDTHDFNENDIWQQLMLSHKSGKSSFKHRFRFEERFIEKVVQTPDNTYITDATDYKMRFRYRFTWGIPVIKIKEGKYIGISAFDEIWLNTDKGIVPKSINQNWWYAGVSYPISKKASIDLGYMNAYIPTGNDTFHSNHILQTTLKYHI